MLDVSASIKPTNFTKVKQFEHNFVKNIVVGPNDNQVGTIIFDHDADIVFKLNSCSNTSCALKEIDNIPYRSQFTNVKDALCRLVEGFNESNGARPLSRALFRIAIVMTDGVSNHYHSTCGWDTIEEAAAAVHALKVLVYVIGVGHFDDKELRAIASPVPGAVAYLPDFDLYPQRWEQTFDDVCKRGIYMYE